MKKILIIEDNEFIQEQVGLLLDSKGFQSFGAFEGGEAFEILHKEEIDLILCDLMMPGMNGFDFIKNYLEQTLNPVKVIAMTAILGARGVSEESLIESGFSEVITKPFDFDYFIQLVERTLAENA